MQNYESVLRYAMQMELDGYNFFKEHAEKFTDPTPGKLFRDLAEIEMEHYKYLEKQLNKYLEENSFDPNQDLTDVEDSIFETREKSEHLGATLQESDIPDITILRMAYLIERDFKEFYEDAASKAEDQGAKAVFKKLAQWEKGHEDLFKKEYDQRMKEYMSLPWGG